MDEYLLRPATEQDVDALAYALAGVDKNDVAKIEACRNRILAEVRGEIPQSTTYVIECSSEAMGRLRLVETQDGLFIGGIQLLPQHQGNGLGSQILRSLIERTTSAGESLRLEVEKTNPKAKKLYLKLGFAVEQAFEDKDVMVLQGKD